MLSKALNEIETYASKVSRLRRVSSRCRSVVFFSLYFLLSACEEPPAPELPEPSGQVRVDPGEPTPVGPAAELLKPPALQCKAEDLLDPGPTLARRLTRIEYKNVVQDLFGFEVALERLPAEEVA